MEPLNGGVEPPGILAGKTGNLTQLSSVVAHMFEMQTSIARIVFFVLPFFHLSTVQENNGGKAE